MILEKFIGRLCFRKMRNMSEIIQANYSWSKTSGETDLGRNVWTQDISPQDNSPHIKLALKQLAPDSETNSPHVVILHNILKYAGKIINILKFYSASWISILLIDLTTHQITYFWAYHLSAVSFEDNPLLHQSILSAFVLEITGRRKIRIINLLPQ